MSESVGGDALPPLQRLSGFGYLFKRPRDNLRIRPDAATPAELPQLLGGPVVLMNRLVYGVGVDLTSAIPIQLFGDVLDEFGSRASW